jgi:GNAT superfamily N-acetyltransferase
MVQLVLRRAGAVDVGALARIHLDARRAAEGCFPPAVHQDSELAPHLLTEVLPKAEAWLAELNDEAVGMLVLESDFIEQLYVTPSFQGQGIGAALLEHAKAQRPLGLRLWVFVSNEPARAFYARRGFVAIGSSDGSANEEGAPDLLLGWPG